MGIVFLTGSHPRHAYLARCLASTGRLAGLVIEERGEHVPAPPNDIPAETQDLFREHFAARAESEARFFSDGTLPPGIPVHRVEADTLNSADTHAFLREHAPEVMLSYGVHKLTDETLDCAPGERWNLHGGLSPWYRGCITHFWPSYNLEPQMTGMTVHTLTQDIDGGEVVHQCAAPLVRGDGLHDLSCRAVYQLGDELPELIRKQVAGELERFKAQTTSGRIWRSADWRPAHLHLVYELYGNQLVDRQLDGELGGREPKLVRQF